MFPKDGHACQSLKLPHLNPLPPVHIELGPVLQHTSCPSEGTQGTFQATWMVEEAWGLHPLSQGTGLKINPIACCQNPIPSILGLARQWAWKEPKTQEFGVLCWTQSPAVDIEIILGWGMEKGWRVGRRWDGWGWGGGEEGMRVMEGREEELGRCKWTWEKREMGW